MTRAYADREEHASMVSRELVDTARRAAPRVALLGIFVYVLAHGLTLPHEAGYVIVLLAVLGVLAATVHLVVATYRDYRIATGSATAQPSAQILDTAMARGDGTTARPITPAVTFVVACLIFYAAAWVVSFHIALPTFIGVYTWRSGGIRSPLRCLLLAVASLVVMLILFDQVMLASWPPSLVEQMLDIRFNRLIPPVLW